VYIRAVLFKRPTRKGSVSVRSSTKDSLFFFLFWSVLNEDVFSYLCKREEEQKMMNFDF
jgi:hypothetical protein